MKALYVLCKDGEIFKRELSNRKIGAYTTKGICESISRQEAKKLARTQLEKEGLSSYDGRPHVQKRFQELIEENTKALSCVPYGPMA